MLKLCVFKGDDNECKLKGIIVSKSLRLIYRPSSRNYRYLAQSYKTLR